MTADQHDQMIAAMARLRAAADEIDKIMAADIRTQFLSGDANPTRILFESDSYCPNCGHNRDASCISSIDNEDGTRSCQLCNIGWIEIVDAGDDR